MKSSKTHAILNAELEPDMNEAFLRIIDRRSREIAEGKIHCRPLEKVVNDIRRKLRVLRSRDK